MIVHRARRRVPPPPLAVRLPADGDRRQPARRANSPACRSRRYKILAFVLCGTLAAIAGILDFSFIQTSQPNTGLSYTFPVFAAVIIGGASLSGGKGTVIGTLGGALLLAELQLGLSILSPGPHVQQIFLGAVTIGAVALDLGLTQSASGGRRERRRRRGHPHPERRQALRQHRRARRHRPRPPARRGARHRRAERRRQVDADPHDRRRGAAGCRHPHPRRPAVVPRRRLARGRRRPPGAAALPEPDGRPRTCSSAARARASAGRGSASPTPA